MNISLFFNEILFFSVLIGLILAVITYLLISFVSKRQRQQQHTHPLDANFSAADSPSHLVVTDAQNGEHTSEKLTPPDFLAGESSRDNDRLDQSKSRTLQQKQKRQALKRRMTKIKEPL